MTRHDDQPPPMRARIPADVDRADVIAFGLTGRQLLIFAIVGLLLYSLWQALLPWVEPLILLVVTIPIVAATFAIAVGRRDGITFDRWLLAAVRHRRSPRRLVPATAEQITPAPAWVATTTGPGHRLPLPAPLRLPAKGITGEGTIDLGPDGHVALLDATTVNFALRSPAEQNALAAGFGRLLNSLDGPAQIVVRAQRVDLAGYATRILDRAPSLPDPALEDAATAHAEFLTELAAERELLHRQVTVAVRDRRGAMRAVHRAAEAARALSACEVTAQVLDGAGAAARLSASFDPTGIHRLGGELR
ncbi:MAG: PrgI family protein [Micromonosporaceae bacterium]|nr:PrgI family protein [Micromonosporaceae bacterium]